MDTTTQTLEHDTSVPTENTALLESKHDMRDALLMASLAGNLFLAALWISVHLSGL